MTDRLTGKPTWLITGAHGFLGTNIGAFLKGRVRRVGAARTEASSNDFDAMITTDLLRPTELATQIRELRPDVIVHSAALAHHDRCEADPELATAVNATASQELARAAHDAGSTFILISTDAVFDGTRGHYSEDDPPNPISVYGRSKALAEELVLAETNAIVIRTNFFGWSPTGTRSILEFFVNALSSGTKVRGFTDFTTSSAYAPVLANVLWQIATPSVSGLFHVTSSDAMTKYDFGVEVARAFALDSSLIAPTRADVHPPRRGDISLNVAKIEEVLGIRLPTMRQGIEAAHKDRDLARDFRESAR